METEAHRMVRRLAAALEAGRPLPADLATWLRAGVADYLAGGRSLDRCLGLKGAGVRSIETVIAQERRNAALKAAAEFAHDGQPNTRHDRARKLAGAVRRFRNRKWPRLCHLDEPPVSLGPMERHLFRAFKESERVPETDKQIYACIRPGGPRAK